MSDCVRPNLQRLLIRPGAIGDFLLSLPALQSLQSTYTEVWCAAQNVPLALFADRAFSISSTGLDRLAFFPTPELLERLQRFDEIHSWYGASRDEFREAVSGLPFHFHTALPHQRTPYPPLHATEFFCRQVGAPCSVPRLPIRPVPRSIAVIHPFASSSAKRWPLEHFRKLASLLGDVRFCAGPQEPLDSAVRIGDLGDLARWLASARVFIGNDSGITHLAAAVGTPVIALFGPTAPEVWAPRGDHVKVIAQMPMEQIRPEEVAAAVTDLLDVSHTPGNILL